MKYEKVQAMTDAELANSLEELRREKLTLKIQSRTGQLEKSARVREVRELLQDRVVFQHVQGRFHWDSPRFRFRKGGGSAAARESPGAKITRAKTRKDRGKKLPRS